MSDIELVIKIPEEKYKNAKLINWANIKSEQVDDWANIIANGTPLKHHGRLKDIDDFLTKVKADRKHSAYLRSWTADDVLNALDNNYTPTIIEASDNNNV